MTTKSACYLNNTRCLRRAKEKTVAPHWRTENTSVRYSTDFLMADRNKYVNDKILQKLFVLQCVVKKKLARRKATEKQPAMLFNCDLLCNKCFDSMAEEKLPFHSSLRDLFFLVD